MSGPALLRGVVLAILLSLADSLAAQDAPAPRALCFNGGRLPSCKRFVVVEGQAVVPVLQSIRHGRFVVNSGQIIPEERELFEFEPQWELGLMQNISERWAVGGAARLGRGADGALTGITVRTRRWLTDAFALELGAGATFKEIDRTERVTGLVADGRLNFNDDLYAGLRFEQVTMDPYECCEWSEVGRDFQEGGPERAVSLLVGVGTEWAMLGSALGGIVLLAFLSTVESN